MKTFKLGAACAASAIAILASLPAHAQFTELPQIVITPNRAPTEAERSGSRVETVTRMEMEEQDLPLAVDYLERLPGISVTSPGGPGAEGSLSVRGAPRRYVKTLYNGIDIGDPTSTQVQTSYQYLLSGGLDSIEVLKGSQSTLYGSDAIAGVISFSTLGDIEPGVSHILHGEAGSRGTVRGGYGLRAANDSGRAAVNITGFRTDGISAAAGGTERDGYENVTFDAAGDYWFNDVFSVFGSLLYIDAEAEYDVDRYVDSFTGEIIEPQDTDENINNNEQMAARVGFNANFLDDRLKNSISFQHFEVDRTIRSDHPEFGRFDADYVGDRQKIDYQGSFDVNNWLLLQYGADHERQRAQTVDNYGADTDDKFSTTGAWTQAIFEPTDFLTLSAGLRYTDHSEFGGHTTYRATGSYTFGDSGYRLHGSLGTGFRAPSIFELYAPPPFPGATPTGNTDLQPEESISFDVGLEYRLNDQLVADVTYFYLDIDDLIQFSSGRYNQVPGTSRQRGIEASLIYEANNWLSLGAAYTYTHARDANDNRNLRVPRHEVALTAVYTPAEKWTISGTAKIAVDTQDEIIVSSVTGPFGFSGVNGRVKLDDYVLVNAKVAYQATESTEVYVRGENLLDQDYQTVRGFGTPGIGVFAGFRSKF